MNASEQQSVHAPAQDTVTKARVAKPRARASRPSAKPVGRTRKPKRPSQATTRKGTKTAKILALLGRPDGASLQELTKATGWQAHSVRGFLSGTLNKKMGLRIHSDRRDDGQRAYRVISK
jgi:hypothetical protein